MIEDRMRGGSSSEILRHIRVENPIALHSVAHTVSHGEKVKSIAFRGS